MPKYEVIATGLFGAKGAIPVGETFEAREISRTLESKVRQVGGGRKQEQSVVTNPSSDSKVDQKRMSEFTAAVKAMKPEDFNEDKSPDVRALNEAKGEKVRNFSAEERDTLWSVYSNTGAQE